MKLVRVLFYYTSIQARRENEDIRGVTQQCSTSARNLIDQEQRAGEQLAQGALEALYGDKISVMDIITATLQLRTVEGLNALTDRLVIILDPDKNQVERLVKEYAFPTDCCDTRVLFLASRIDTHFEFKLQELRDTSRDQVVEEAVN